jgi:hypothetical protein
VAELENGNPVPACDDLKACTNILTLKLSSGPLSRTAEPLPSDPARNWLIQAKAAVLTQAETTNDHNVCGLVNVNATGPKAVLDEVDAPRDPERADGVALSAVVKKGAENPTVAVRCTAHDAAPRTDAVRDLVSADSVKIIATEVGAVTAPDREHPVASVAVRVRAERLSCGAFLSIRLHGGDQSCVNGPDPSHGNVEVSFHQPAGADEPPEYQHAVAVILEALGYGSQASVGDPDMPKPAAKILPAGCAPRPFEEAEHRRPADLGIDEREHLLHITFLPGDVDAPDQVDTLRSHPVQCPASS